MKRFLKILLIIGLIALGFFGYLFYKNQLSGATAVFKTPSTSIQSYFTSENWTDFPLTLPDGFKIELLADGFDKPRDIAHGPGGSLLLSDTNAGVIYKLKGREKTRLIEGLNRPHGVNWVCQEEGCSIFVAEVTRIAEYTEDGAFIRKVMDLPEGGRHYTRTMLFPRFAEDPNAFYVSIGSSCDTCYEDDERYASVLKADIETGQWEVYAEGLRNAVFMNIHPVTGEIWVTEMGRDHLGDNLPPDEVNILKEGDFGWPICYGQNIHDTKFDKNQYIQDPCTGKIPAKIDLTPAHSAPLGLGFIPEEGWPEAMWYDLIVAFHGSWNRTEPAGYKLVRYPLDAMGNSEGEPVDFVAGWLTDNGASLGRPVDVLIQPGGLMYITDDKAGVVYKVSYQPELTTVRVSDPAPGSQVSKSFTIKGEAPGPWFFEASLPVTILDEDGNTLLQHYAEAQDEWMTESQVPFEAAIDLDTDYSGPITLVIQKDNPSGLPKFDKKIEIPLTLNP